MKYFHINYDIVDTYQVKVSGKAESSMDIWTQTEKEDDELIHVARKQIAEDNTQPQSTTITMMSVIETNKPKKNNIIQFPVQEASHEDE